VDDAQRSESANSTSRLPAASASGRGDGVKSKSGKDISKMSSILDEFEE